LTTTPDAPPDAGVSLFTAVQEQLGLKLESSRAPLEVLVIDSVERPTPKLSTLAKVPAPNDSAAAAGAQLSATGFNNRYSPSIEIRERKRHIPACRERFSK